MQALLSLQKYLSLATHDDLEYQIAVNIFKNLDNLDYLTAEKLAKMSYVSQATVTRFVQKLGYSSYKFFKDELEDIYDTNSLIDQTMEKNDTKEIIQFVANSSIQNLEYMVNNLIPKQIDSLIQKISNSDHVVFLGGGGSLGTFYKFKGILLEDGIIALIPQDYEEIIWLIDNATKKDLFILATLNGRWIQESYGYKLLKRMEEKKIRLIILSLNQTVLDYKWVEDSFALGNSNVLDSGLASLAAFMNIITSKYLLERMAYQIKHHDF